MKPWVVVTRPDEQGRVWAEALQAQGWTAVLLPLIATVPPGDLEALALARAGWRDFDAVMFVSGQAVKHFFENMPPNKACMAEAPWPRCWCPGPGTAQALLQHGIPAGQIDTPALDSEQFDSEALWRAVGSQVRPGHRLLLVRGDGGRDWLAQQCLGQGGQVQVCSAYQRRAPVWSAQQQQQAHAATGPAAVWLLTSSEAVAHLKDLLPNAHWDRARAVATHPRIAATAHEIGFGQVLHSHPALQAVLHTLESLH